MPLRSVNPSFISCWRSTAIAVVKCKKTTMKATQKRNEQFENIARLKGHYEAEGNPIISMDTKKKEYWGNFYRAGKLYTRQVIKVYDHDFASFADGIVIPHGIYDLQKN